MLDDRPVLSGRHPLHLYHGWLGAQGWIQRGSPNCYDPIFQAGYPKTPVFDSGSRLAEAFMLFAGGSFSPAAYKIGIAAICLSVPLCFAVAARLLGLCWITSIVVVACGMLLLWAGPGMSLLVQGDLEVVVAGESALLGIACLLRYDRTSSARAWVGLLLAGLLGWYAQPFILIALLPLVLIYYLSVGGKHGLCWHSFFFLALGLPLLLHVSWMFSLLSYWWIRSPLNLEAPILAHRTAYTLWQAPIWGGPGARACTLIVLAMAILGVVTLNEARERAAARLYGSSAIGLMLFAIAGIAWDPLGRLGTPKLLLLSLWLALLPAGYALSRALAVTGRRLAWPSFRLACMGGSLAFVACLWLGIPQSAAQWLRSEPSLRLDREAWESAVLQAVEKHTRPDARILWETVAGSPQTSHWPVLLPRSQDRQLLGGFDLDGCLEHSQVGLKDGVLAGRPMFQWTDGELDDYRRKYNIGWVLCCTTESYSRLRSWGAAKLLASGLAPDGGGHLFELPAGSYVLQGKAKIERIEPGLIALADVTPEGGYVVLSLNYDPGLRALPSRVTLEKEPSPYSAIPLLRLKLSEPLTRVTLVWDDL